ncbi:MAG: TetR/AcrR family transcriptional regulator [Chitinophagales bacterium]
MKQPNLKEKILIAARHILAEEGYTGLSMRKIAKAVDCKAASIYHHFKNKDKIVHTLIDEGHQFLFRLMSQSTEGAKTPYDCLVARANVYVDFGLQYPELYHIMYVLITKNMERYPKENYRRNSLNLAQTIQYLEAAQKRGEIQLKESPEVTANALTAMLHGFITMVHSNRLHIRLDKNKMRAMVIRQALSFS